MVSQIIRKAGLLLAEKNLKVFFTESATAGRLTNTFAMLPESGDILLGGIVTYDKRIKTDLLGVDEKMLNTHTPESEEASRALAERASKLIEADIHIAITGLIAPGGSESKEKPVGTMFVHMIYNNGAYSERHCFDGYPSVITEQCIDATGHLICKIIQ